MLSKNAELEAVVKRLEGFRMAIMIDHEQFERARGHLEMMEMEEEFTHLEQDSKVLVKSLLGLLLRNYSHT